MPLPRTLSIAALLLLLLLGCEPEVGPTGNLSASPTPTPTADATAAPLTGGISG